MLNGFVCIGVVIMGMSNFSLTRPRKESKQKSGKKIITIFPLLFKLKCENEFNLVLRKRIISMVDTEFAVTFQCSMANHKPKWLVAKVIETRTISNVGNYAFVRLLNSNEQLRLQLFLASTGILKLVPFMKFGGNRLPNWPDFNFKSNNFGCFFLVWLTDCLRPRQ